MSLTSKRTAGASGKMTIKYSDVSPVSVAILLSHSLYIIWLLLSLSGDRFFKIIHFLKGFPFCLYFTFSLLTRSRLMFCRQLFKMPKVDLYNIRYEVHRNCVREKIDEKVIELTLDAIYTVLSILHRYTELIINRIMFRILLKVTLDQWSQRQPLKVESIEDKTRNYNQVIICSLHFEDHKIDKAVDRRQLNYEPVRGSSPISGFIRCWRKWGF